MRLRVLGVTLALTVSALPAYSATPPKAGAICAKQGITKSYLGKKFKCVKVGQKFVWDKGVLISKPIPTTNPIASTAPKSVPEISVPTGFDDLLIKYSGVSYGAWKISQDKIRSAPYTSIPYEILLGPNSILNNKNPGLAFTQTYKLFSGAILPKRIVFLAFSYQDRDWAITKMDEITPNAGSGWIKDVACPRQDYCVGGGSFYNKSNKTNLIIIGTGVDPNNPTNAYSGTVEAHEFTHSIQQSVSDEARPPVNLLVSPWPPNWYWEGLAQFSQHAAIYSDSFEDYLEFRRRSTGELFKNPRWNANEIEAYLQTNLTPEWEAKYPRWRMYDLGAMFVEILVSIKGPDLAMELFRESLKNGGFEVAFQKLYGVSFKSVLPTISRTIALQLGN